MNLTWVCRVDGVSRVGAGCSHKYVECISVEYSCWSSITLNRCRKITFYIHTALLTFSVGLRYLVKLVHAEATNFGLDVFAHVFGGRQKATLGLKPQNTIQTDTHRHTETELQSQSQSHNRVRLHPVRLPAPTSRTSSRLQPQKNHRFKTREPLLQNLESAASPSTLISMQRGGVCVGW